MQRCSAALPLNINLPFSFSLSTTNKPKNEVRLRRYRLCSCHCRGVGADRPYCIPKLWCRFIRPPSDPRMNMALTVINRIQMGCVVDSIAGTGCALTDYGCICQNGQLFQLLVPCAASKCEKADQQSEIPSHSQCTGPGGYKNTPLSGPSKPIIHGTNDPQKYTANSKLPALATMLSPRFPQAC